MAGYKAPQSWPSAGIRLRLRHEKSRQRYQESRCPRPMESSCRVEREQRRVAARTHGIIGCKVTGNQDRRVANKARQFCWDFVKRARLRQPTFQRIFGRTEEATGA